MRKLLFLLLAVLLPLSACGDDGPTETSESAVGTYALVQVNGSNLPALFAQDANGKVEVLSGTFTVRSDKSYTETLNGRSTPISGVVQTFSVTENGTYSVSGSTVQFQPSDGGSYSGTLSGNSLSYSVDGVTVRYQKQ